MRGAFVVHLGPESKPTEGWLDGWVEEVDSSVELRFHSAEELLKFMASRFELAMGKADRPHASNRREHVRSDKKRSRHERKSS